MTWAAPHGASMRRLTTMSGYRVAAADCTSAPVARPGVMNAPAPPKATALNTVVVRGASSERVADRPPPNWAVYAETVLPASPVSLDGWIMPPKYDRAGVGWMS